MTKEEALRDFTDAVRGLAVLEDTHPQLFRIYHNLCEQIGELRRQLKVVATEQGDVHNRYFDVTVRSNTHIYYEAEVLIAEYPSVKDIPGVLRTEADRKMVEKMLKAEMLPAEAVEHAKRVEINEPRVYIEPRCSMRGRVLDKKPAAALVTAVRG